MAVHLSVIVYAVTSVMVTLVTRLRPWPPDAVQGGEKAAQRVRAPTRGHERRDAPTAQAARALCGGPPGPLRARAAVQNPQSLTTVGLHEPSARHRRCGKPPAGGLRPTTQLPVAVLLAVVAGQLVLEL